MGWSGGSELMDQKTPDEHALAIHLATNAFNIACQQARKAGLRVDVDVQARDSLSFGRYGYLQTECFMPLPTKG
jgi:hypothetical protein